MFIAVLVFKFEFFLLFVITLILFITLIYSIYEIISSFIDLDKRSLGTNKIFINSNHVYTEANSETVPDGGMFLNKNDGYVYVYDAAAGTFSKTGKDYVPVEITETHVLTAEEVTAKSFTLTNAVKTGEETNILCFVQGIAQAAGVAEIYASLIRKGKKTIDDVPEKLREAVQEILCIKA